MPSSLHTRHLLPSLLLVVAVGSGINHLNADDWSQWRGPTGLAIAADGTNIPTDFSPSKSLLWSAQVPGAGHSSPTIVGDLVVVTTADSTSQRQAVLGFERSTGRKAFTTIVSEGGFPETHPKNTHASATVCSNGELFLQLFITTTRWKPSP